MIRRPHRSTRPDTRFPYTPPVRATTETSAAAPAAAARRIQQAALDTQYAQQAADRKPAYAAQHGRPPGAERHPRHCRRGQPGHDGRSEEHTSELQSLMRISYAVFCLTKKTNNTRHQVKVNTT